MVVRESMWMSRLHDAIQLASGWFDYQIHRFTVNEAFYGNPVRRENQTEIEDDRDFARRSGDRAQRGVSLRVFFGDTWQVDIRVEKAEPAQTGVKYPHLTDGKVQWPA
ncbi:MAG: hypothetical protein IPL39_13695 [Opitutaceae bacterium]|nr:hypothetical protein [Opitutaceae bacterium]